MKCSLKTRLSPPRSTGHTNRLSLDMRQLQAMIQARMRTAGRFQVGQRVRVKLGPLADLEGTVINRLGETRLAVGLDCLEQGASLEIEGYCLEPL